VDSTFLNKLNWMGAFNSPMIDGGSKEDGERLGALFLVVTHFEFFAP
jgi:hypothetical protein